METQAFNTLALVHLLFLSMWGGASAPGQTIPTILDGKSSESPDLSGA